jgi:hypothetical protein
MQKPKLGVQIHDLQLCFSLLRLKVFVYFRGISMCFRTWGKGRQDVTLKLFDIFSYLNFCLDYHFAA